jgi:hypothetical protein
MLLERSLREVRKRLWRQLWACHSWRALAHSLTPASVRAHLVRAGNLNFLFADEFLLRFYEYVRTSVYGGDVAACETAMRSSVRVRGRGGCQAAVSERYEAIVTVSSNLPDGFDVRSVFCMSVASFLLLLTRTCGNRTCWCSGCEWRHQVVIQRILAQVLVYAALFAGGEVVVQYASHAARA